MNYKSVIFSKYIGDEQMLRIVDDEAWIAKMLRFEATLAKAQATVNIIPSVIAEEIAHTIKHVKITPSDLAAGTLQNGIPVITLLLLIKENLPDKSKKYLHFGVTSQDVMDTAQILIIQDAIRLIEERITILIKNLSGLYNQYGKIPCMARTRGQQAIPITFGVKINAWLQPLQRQMVRLQQIKKNILIVQLGGAAGTLNMFPDKAESLTRALAKKLKLQPVSSWHSQRDRICEFTNWLAILTGITGKMGADILVLAQTEINEVRESTNGGKSSAMPHKNNPVLSEALVALARINGNLQSQQIQSMLQANERDATAWILEWNAIPQMLINTATALQHANCITAGIIINKEAMKKNINQFNY